MKTKLGSCNTDSKNILLNLELAKKLPVWLEYILVYELVHLHERKHNDRFVSLMDKFMPKCSLLNDELNKLPIVHYD
jgi:predicted metal-dependent hydrolase